MTAIDRIAPHTLCVIVGDGRQLGDNRGVNSNVSNSCPWLFVRPQRESPLTRPSQMAAGETGEHRDP